MGCVDAQFAEDILAVGSDGVDAGEAFGSNLLGGLTLSNSFHDFGLCSRQDAGCLVVLLLCDNGFEGALAEIARMAFNAIQSFAYLAERTVLENDAELMGRKHNATNELGGQFVANKNPVGQVETLGNDE